MLAEPLPQAEAGRLSCQLTKEKVGVSVGVQYNRHLHGAVCTREVNRSRFQRSLTIELFAFIIWFPW